MNNWVCLVKGESGNWITEGPLSDAELKAKIAGGELSLKSWVWRRGLKRWTMVSELKVSQSATTQWSYEPELRESEVQFAELK